MCINLLQGFYEEVSSPLLSEVDLRYPDNAVDFLTTNHFSQLFNGSEIVVAGRLMDNDLDNFLVEVFAQGVRKRNITKLKILLRCRKAFFQALFLLLSSH